MPRTTAELMAGAILASRPGGVLVERARLLREAERGDRAPVLGACPVVSPFVDWPDRIGARVADLPPDMWGELVESVPRADGGDVVDELAKLAARYSAAVIYFRDGLARARAKSAGVRP